MAGLRKICRKGSSLGEREGDGLVVAGCALVQVPSTPPPPSNVPGPGNSASEGRHGEGAQVYARKRTAPASAREGYNFGITVKWMQSHGLARWCASDPESGRQWFLIMVEVWGKNRFFVPTFFPARPCRLIIALLNHLSTAALSYCFHP